MDSNIAATDIELFINELISALEREITGPNGDAFLEGLGVIFGLSVGALAVTAIGLIINLICRWRIFTKAGEKGWKSLIPVYSTYIEYTFTWSKLQGILMLSALLVSRIISFACGTEGFIALIGSLFALYAAILALIQVHKLSLSFGHKFGFTLGLFFLNPIFMLILAFGKKSQYVGPAVKSK